MKLYSNEMVKAQLFVDMVNLDPAVNTANYDLNEKMVNVDLLDAYLFLVPDKANLAYCMVNFVLVKNKVNGAVNAVSVFVNEIVDSAVDDMVNFAVNNLDKANWLMEALAHRNNLFYDNRFAVVVVVVPMMVDMNNFQNHHVFVEELLVKQLMLLLLLLEVVAKLNKHAANIVDMEMVNLLDCNFSPDYFLLLCPYKNRL